VFVCDPEVGVYADPGGGGGTALVGTVC
jgi:hypothetical protein